MSTAPSTDTIKAFHRACFGGDIATVKALIAADESLALHPDKHGASGLHQAAFAGHADIVVLLSYGASVWALDAEKCTPLHNAVFKCHEACVDALIAAGADINHPDSDCSTPLHKAAFAGSATITKKLLLAGARIDVVDVDGATALHKAAFKNHNDCLALLLGAGLDANLTDGAGATALHKAAYGGSADCITTLLNAGVSINVVDREGFTPLQLAARKRHCEAVTRLAVAPGCDINHVTASHNETALHWAVRGGSLECVQALLAAGARADVQNAAGQTAQQLAAADESKASLAAYLSGNAAAAPAAAAAAVAAEPAAAAPDAAPAVEAVVSAKGKEEKPVRDANGDDDDDSLDGDGGKAAVLEKAPVDRWGFLVVDGKNDAALTAVEAEHKRKELERELKWVEMSTDWDRWSTRRRKKLRLRCIKGIPDSMRVFAWVRLADADAARKRHPPNTFQTLFMRTDKSPVVDIIHRDLHRTFPDHLQFRAKAGKQALQRVLKAYSFFNPEIGYCQGMGFVTAMFLMYTVTEEDAFWMLVQMVEKYQMGGLWDKTLTDVGKMCWVHSQLLARFVPRVAAHMDAMQISGALYAPSFYITGFAYSLPWPCVLRVWDAFLVDGMPVLHAVGVALLAMYEPVILGLDFDRLMPFLRFSHTIGETKNGNGTAPVSHVLLGDGLLKWLPKVAKVSARLEREWDQQQLQSPAKGGKSPKSPK